MIKYAAHCLCVILVFYTEFALSASKTTDFSSYYRKPGQLPLVEYKLDGNVKPYELVDLNLTISPFFRYQTSQMVVTVRAEKGLQITKNPVILDKKTWRVQFRATELGRLYLNVYVREKNIQQLERFVPKAQQVFSIPVQVGDGP